MGSLFRIRPPGSIANVGRMSIQKRRLVVERIGDILKRQVPKISKTASGDPLIEPEYKCQICKDSGIVHPVEDGKVRYDKVVSCKCMAEILEKEKQERYLRLCRLPADTEGMTLETFETYENPSLIEALTCAKVLAEGTEEIRWLTLIGKVDRGKTHLAVATCRRWMERGVAARYAFVPLLLKELRDGFQLEGEQSYRRKMNFLCEVGLLVLDDLGLLEKPSPWAQEQIQTIVHYRGINGLPLVVTSNKLLDEMPIDPERRIASRLQRERWCRVVALDIGEHRLG